MALTETGSNLDHLTGDERECIELCNDATDACEWCAEEALGDPEMEECARLCRDVADVASLHARLVARDSKYSTQLATICANLCEECAEECSRHDHQHCQVCAEILPKCADSCRRMATA